MILKTNLLTKKFGGFTAVDEVNFSVEEGEIRSIIGPNGAGKTTLFNLITGCLKPTMGEVWFGGKKITGLSSYEICRKGIARSYQITTIFPNLTVFENVRIAAQRKKVYNFWSRAESIKEINEKTMSILEDIGLLEKKDFIASNLSHGEQRKLEVGIALAAEPKLLLLDEPTVGMNPPETKEMMNFIKVIHRSKKLTVVLVEHDMDVVMGLSDRITVMHEGKILAEGERDEIQNNEKVREVYLGE